jgi:hypothetical protein
LGVHGQLDASRGREAHDIVEEEGIGCDEKGSERLGHAQRFAIAAAGSTPAATAWG